MKGRIFMSLLLAVLCMTVVSCSDEEQEYFMSEEALPRVLGGFTFKSPNLWNAEGKGVSAECKDGAYHVYVPAQGGRVVFTVNPEAEYFLYSHEADITEYGPYVIPQTLYPVPDCVYEFNAEGRKGAYYTCAPADNYLWPLAYSGPLETPFGNFSMEKNKLVMDLKACKDAAGRELSLQIALCEDLQASFAARQADFAGTGIIVHQGDR